MPSPTRQEIIDAHDALEEFYNSACALNWGSSHEREEDWHSAIFKLLPPKPTPNMADTCWQNERHYLAEAETENGDKVVMLSQEENSIMCIQPSNAEGVVVEVPRRDITPTGRKYQLKEIENG